MSKKVKRHTKTGRFSNDQKLGKSAYVVEHKKSAQGGETWHIVSDTGSHKIRTSPSSVKVMDEAKVIYADALERLAKR